MTKVHLNWLKHTHTNRQYWQTHPITDKSLPLIILIMYNIKFLILRCENDEHLIANNTTVKRVFIVF